MPNVVSCPACNRRLLLPGRYQGEIVQCPSCAARFAAEVPLDIPDTAIVTSPSLRESVPSDGSGRKDPRPLGLPDFSRRRPTGKSRGVVWVVGAVVLVVGLGVFGFVSWMRAHNRPVTPARVPENRNGAAVNIDIV